MASTKIRHLVLDRTNTPQRPADSGLHLRGVQNPKSPSFLDKDEAAGFQAMLAQNNPGQAFYLATVESVAIAYDKVGVDADGRDVEVTACTAAGTGDE